MGESFITAIQPIKFGEGFEQVNKAAEQNGVTAFKSIFDEAVQNVKTTETDLVEKQYLLATGQIEDAHSVAIASSQAQLAVDMLVSMRNKALESYNEIMRISL